MTTLTIPDIKREAQARLPELLAAMGVHQRPYAGGYISMSNPMRKDRKASFTIWTGGSVAGAWRDEARIGVDQGDVIDLCSYLNGWWERPSKGRGEALRFIIATLGLQRIDPGQLQRDRAMAKRRALEEEKHRAEELLEHQARARSLFLAAGGKATDDPVRTYLEFRGIDLSELPRGPRGGRRAVNVIRGIRSHKHSESGQWLPCMIAACVCPRTWKILAVHRTWLRADGTGKADVVPVKKVWPSFAGLVIPLWRGESNLSVNEAIAAGLRETLVLCEGIEDGLSAVMSGPRFRTWAFIALGNLGKVRLPECIDSVILHRQNELDNRVATLTFERGKAALADQGRPIAEVEAFCGKDLNDTLRSAG